ncbi:MAG: hypothetical protein ACN4GW_02250 [Desulforhopalus sp.]
MEKRSLRNIGRVEIFSADHELSEIVIIPLQFYNDDIAGNGLRPDTGVTGLSL